MCPRSTNPRASRFRWADFRWFPITKTSHGIPQFVSVVNIYMYTQIDDDLLDMFKWLSHAKSHDKAARTYHNQQHAHPPVRSWDTEPRLAWVPQRPLYPTHPCNSRLGEHHSCQRPNWRLISRLQQGFWHHAPQTTADETTTLRYWWQN